MLCNGWRLRDYPRVCDNVLGLEGRQDFLVNGNKRSGNIFALTVDLYQYTLPRNRDSRAG